MGIFEILIFIFVLKFVFSKKGRESIFSSVNQSTNRNDIDSFPKVFEAIANEFNKQAQRQKAINDARKSKKPNTTQSQNSTPSTDNLHSQWDTSKRANPVSSLREFKKFQKYYVKDCKH